MENVILHVREVHVAIGGYPGKREGCLFLGASYQAVRRSWMREGSFSRFRDVVVVALFVIEFRVYSVVVRENETEDKTPMKNEVGSFSLEGLTSVDNTLFCKVVYCVS